MAFAESKNNIDKDLESDSEDSVPLFIFLDEDEESDNDENTTDVNTKHTLARIRTKTSQAKSIIGNRPLTDYIFANVTTYNFKTWRQCFPTGQVSLRSLVFNAAWNEFFDIVETRKYFKNMEKILSTFMDDKNRIIVPHAELVFNAFNILSPHKIKCVIIGQDPYPGINDINGKEIPQAMGMSFTVPLSYPKPPSLNNIYQNLQTFGHIKQVPNTGCLSSWALQGCFMINASLTTMSGERNMHNKIWTQFTDDLISYLNTKLSNLAFMVWGGPAHGLCRHIDVKRHYITTSSHPSPLAFHKTLDGFAYGLVKSEANRKRVTYPTFRSTDHFGRVNTYLASVNKSKFIWHLIDI